MTGIIIAFPKQANGNNIRNILARNGYPVMAVCTSGSQVLQEAHSLQSGIVMCGYQLTDMMYSELKEYLPEGFDMLLISGHSELRDVQCDGLVRLPSPLKVHELLSTLEMMVYTQERRKKRRKSKPRKRTKEEQELINKAKAILYERNGMSEEEAHRYLQKCSMDSGTTLQETAQMVISMLDM